MWRLGLAHSWAKTAAGLLCGLPLLYLVWAAWADRLGANPAEALIRETGDWALRGVCLALAVTPLRVMCKLPVLARWRRMLGLWAFAYAALHVLAYAWLDMGLDVLDMVRDVGKRPFILVGLCALMILLALATTSFNQAIRWLGATRWQQLHRSVYLAGVLVILHFFWMRASKNNLAEVLWYAGLMACLLGWRLKRRWSRQV